jgi:hypothetical protein
MFVFTLIMNHQRQIFKIENWRCIALPLIVLYICSSIYSALPFSHSHHHNEFCGNDNSFQIYTSTSQTSIIDDGLSCPMCQWINIFHYIIIAHINTNSTIYFDNELNSFCLTSNTINTFINLFSTRSPPIL